MVEYIKLTFKKLAIILSTIVVLVVIWVCLNAIFDSRKPPQKNIEAVEDVARTEK